MPPKANFFQPSGQQDYTPTAAAVAGDIVRLPDNRAGIVIADLAANQKGAVYTENIFDAVSASATLFSDGEEVWWDATNSVAVNAGAATATFRLGCAIEAKINGDTTVRVDLNGISGLAGKQVATAASAAVSNTVVETVVGTLTVPANALKKGAVLAFLAGLIATATNATDTFRFRVRIGGVAGTVVADTTAVDLANNDTGVLAGEIVVRTDGAGGTFAAAAQSILKTTASPTVATGAVDTTAATTLVVTVEESVANAGNSARCDVFNLELR